MTITNAYGHELTANEDLWEDITALVLAWESFDGSEHWHEGMDARVTNLQRHALPMQTAQDVALDQMPEAETFAWPEQPVPDGWDELEDQEKAASVAQMFEEAQP